MKPVPIETMDAIRAKANASSTQSEGEANQPHEELENDIASRYVFVRPLSKFYDKATGTLMSIPALNQSEFVLGADGKPSTASYFFKKNGGESVDGLGWQPCPANSVPDACVNVRRKKLINTYECPEVITHLVTESAIKPWFEMMAHIIPDEKERNVYMDHMAATIQHPEKKIHWQVLNYGEKRIGKDAILRALVNYFGSLVSEISPEMSATQWGDTRAKKKMLVFAEVLQPGDRSFENNLKLLAAGTATGIDTVNMKGGAVVEQPNLYSIYAMSNHTDCMHLSAGDSRWFVIDSFNIEKRTAEEYDKYFNWIDDTGWRDVIAWLLKRDLSNFTWGRPPYQTAAYMRLVEESRSTISLFISESIEQAKDPCNKDLISTSEVVMWLRENGQRASASILKKEMLEMGCVHLERGQKKIGTKLKRTPSLVAVRNVEKYQAMTQRELYEAWNSW